MEGYDRITDMLGYSYSEQNFSFLGSARALDNRLGIHNLDSRELNTIVTEAIVDVTVTSPPYFDLKDYEHKDQIGFGQNYEEYLNDLKKVFTNVYNATKQTGTLWVIIDSFRREGEVTPLPFDFANVIKPIGWKLQDIIIWGKDRTVPWTHKGQMRNLYEFILVFSKSPDYKFHIERVKDFESLKKWWIRYPERYNPKGKTPDAIWHFDIPTQGSWGNGYIRHFCPLPEKLISQILRITTDEGDIVLDPFAGSGAVLSRADNMKRKFIGFELNADYIQMFKTYLGETGERKRTEYEKQELLDYKQEEFQKLIIDLRALKFARVFFQILQKESENLVVKILVEKTETAPTQKHKLQTVKYHLLLAHKSEFDVQSALKNIESIPPLSKFGIEADFVIHENVESFAREMEKHRNLYLYTNKNTHSYKQEFTLSSMSRASKDEIIISDIRLKIDESMFA